MKHPANSVRVTIGDGKGGSITKSTTQGAIASTLIGANAVYTKGDGTANAKYGNETLTIHERGIKRDDRSLAITIIHEGMHGTPMDLEFRQDFWDKAWFWQNPFKQFNDAHQRSASPTSEGYSGAAERAFDNEEK